MNNEILKLKLKNSSIQVIQNIYKGSYYGHKGLNLNWIPPSGLTSRICTIYPLGICSNIILIRNPFRTIATFNFVNWTCNMLWTFRNNFLQ